MTRCSENLKQGLVRVTFSLPPNIKLIDPVTDQPSSETFVDVWRMVPSVNNVALTGPDTTSTPWPSGGPNPTGGYQLDARVGTLQDQALGALVNHAQIQHMPSPQFLDDVASFQRALFTNHRVRKLAEAISAGETPLPDPDPKLNKLEKKGKAIFERACTQCHGGPGQSSPSVPLRFADIKTQCPRPVDLRPVDVVVPPRFEFAQCPDHLTGNARTYEIALSVDTRPPDGRLLPRGTKVRLTSSDPGRALTTGFVGGPPARDDWQKFDAPGLRGIGKTAPYFHNNIARTLEDVVDHYIEFFKWIEATVPPGSLPPPVSSTDGVNFDRRPTPEEREALVAYLRKL